MKIEWNTKDLILDKGWLKKLLFKLFDQKLYTLGQCFRHSNYKKSIKMYLKAIMVNSKGKPQNAVHTINRVLLHEMIHAFSWKSSESEVEVAEFNLSQGLHT